jgi:hypothetical protein
MIGRAVREVGSALTPRHVALLDAHRDLFETASRAASLRMLLDGYIASVPGLAEAFDPVVTDPTVGMLQKLTKALGVPVMTLLK